MRPHQPLEAALATCMTISARTALADLDQPSTGVVVRLHQDRGESATRVRYEVVLDPPLERTAQRSWPGWNVRRSAPPSPGI
jgi:putative redox protein